MVRHLFEHNIQNKHNRRTKLSIEEALSVSLVVNKSCEQQLQATNKSCKQAWAELCQAWAELCQAQASLKLWKSLEKRMSIS